MDKKINSGNRVLVVIMTDGLENASIEYNREQVRKMIKKHKKQNWQEKNVDQVPQAKAQRGEIIWEQGSLMSSVTLSNKY